MENRRVDKKRKPLYYRTLAIIKKTVSAIMGGVLAASKSEESGNNSKQIIATATAVAITGAGIVVAAGLVKVPMALTLLGMPGFAGIP